MPIINMNKTFPKVILLTANFFVQKYDSYFLTLRYLILHQDLGAFIAAYMKGEQSAFLYRDYVKMNWKRAWDSIVPSFFNGHVNT